MDFRIAEKFWDEYFVYPISIQHSSGIEVNVTESD